MISIKNVFLDNLNYPISFKVQPGHCLGIMGDSGIGKTRLLRVIADLEESPGIITFNDLDSYQYDPTVWRSMISYLAAESLWWFDIVKDHFISRNSLNLEKLHLQKSILSKPVVEPSTGERQRLALLRLLNHNTPEVLLLDEPTSALDDNNTKILEDYILSLKTNSNLPVIWVSHDLNQIERVSDRAIKLTTNKVIEII